MRSIACSLPSRITNSSLSTSRIHVGMIRTIRSSNMIHIISSSMKTSIRSNNVPRSSCMRISMIELSRSNCSISRRGGSRSDRMIIM